MLRKINWFAVMGPMLITAMVLSACGGGASTQPSSETPQSTAASTEAPQATEPSSVTTPEATAPSAETPQATDQSMVTPEAPASSGETPQATEASPMTTPEATGSPSASGGALAAPGAAVQMANDAKLGDILTDSQGMTLYIFKNDTPGTSNCNGTCIQNWPPLTVAEGHKPVAGTGVSGTLSSIDRPDGTYQVTYNDMPLYHFTGDKQPGDTNGQGVAGLWSVVTLTAAAPAAPAAATPAAPAAAPTTSSSMDTPAAPAVTPQATSSY